MSRAVRILYVHNSADLYGASRSLVRLAKCLDKEKFEPVVLLPEEGPLASMLLLAGAQVIIFPRLRVITRSIFRSWRLLPWIGGFLPSVFALASIFHQERIALVHTNTGVICSSAFAARLARIPHVWHIRDWFQEFGSLWKPYSRYILAFSARVLCVSKVIADQFPPSAKIEIVNNGFDLSEFPPVSFEERRAARKRWGFSDEDIIVGTVGRIKFFRKGQEFLLQAIGKLKENGVNVKCLLAGGVPPGCDDQLIRMQALADKLGLDVVFAGELKNARVAYAAMDIFVLPSAQPEPFGGVVMEAMAFGLPVIGTNIGGTLEQIVPDCTGLLVFPADPDSMATAISQLSINPNTRREMGQAGRERIASVFSIDKMGARIAKIYSSILMK